MSDEPDLPLNQNEEMPATPINIGNLVNGYQDYRRETSSDQLIGGIINKLPFKKWMEEKGYDVKNGIMLDLMSDNQVIFRDYALSHRNDKFCVILTSSQIVALLNFYEFTDGNGRDVDAGDLSDLVSFARAEDGAHLTYHAYIVKEDGELEKKSGLLFYFVSDSLNLPNDQVGISSALATEAGENSLNIIIKAITREWGKLEI